jgi:hypothetical protein
MLTTTTPGQYERSKTTLLVQVREREYLKEQLLITSNTRIISWHHQLGQLIGLIRSRIFTFLHTRESDTFKKPAQGVSSITAWEKT